MYLDLLNLETRMYDVRSVLWVVGVALMYFLVLPLYVYKRQRSPTDGRRSGMDRLRVRSASVEPRHLRATHRGHVFGPAIET